MGREPKKQWFFHVRVEKHINHVVKYDMEVMSYENFNKRPLCNSAYDRPGGA